MMECSYDFLIADLLMRVQSPKKLQIPDNFQPFLVTSRLDRKADILLEIDFRLVEADSLQPSEKFHWNNGEYIVCQEPAGRGAPCRLFLPPDFAEDFCRQGHWLNYIPMERLLLLHGRIMLHASAVIHQGRAFLFSAPSGGGKSTHAALWQDHFGAQILNGDKVVLYAKEKGLMACGSPVAGTSGIYVPKSIPLAAVFMLKKAGHNRVLPLSQKEAVLGLYSEAVKSARDAEFNSRLLDCILSMKEKTSIYSLECLPHKSAVECILKETEGVTP